VTGPDLAEFLVWNMRGGVLDALMDLNPLPIECEHCGAEVDPGYMIASGQHRWGALCDKHNTPKNRWRMQRHAERWMARMKRRAERGIRL
jgi:hypothetical protein